VYAWLQWDNDWVDAIPLAPPARSVDGQVVRYAYAFDVADLMSDETHQAQVYISDVGFDSALDFSTLTPAAGGGGGGTVAHGSYTKTCYLPGVAGPAPAKYQATCCDVQCKPGETAGYPTRWNSQGANLSSSVTVNGSTAHFCDWDIPAKQPATFTATCTY
jgi:hypothetical protein